MTERLRLFAAASYIKTRISGRPFELGQVGRQSTATPKFLIKAQAEYSPPILEGLALTAGVQRTSSSFVDAGNTIRNKGFTLADLGARYRFTMGKQAVVLRAEVENITDKRYYSPALIFSPGSPRTGKLSLTVTM